MGIDRSFYTRLAIESLGIVFSVLLALFLNAAWSERAEAAATRELLVSIRAEVEANREILEDWTERHEAIAENLASLRSDPTGQGPLIVDHRLLFDRVLGRSLAESMVRDTAWNTARATGLVRHFDLECVNLLTDIYSLQKTVEGTILDIARLLRERETHREENLAGTLVLLDLSMQELQGQERLLAVGYEAAAETLAQRVCQK